MSGNNEMYSTEYYSYELPFERVAPNPSGQRSSSKLLVLDRKSGGLTNSSFEGLDAFLREDDLLILNDSKVIKARLFGKRPSGGKVEIFLVRPSECCYEKFDVSNAKWDALINPSRASRVGQAFDLGEAYATVVEKKDEGLTSIEFKSKKGESGWSFPGFLAKKGEVPLPPYIKRRRKLQDYTASPFEGDESRYQNVFAVHDGSVAAPTAGLHFDESLLEKLRAKGVEILCITLHVGPGTFRPIKAKDIRKHSMEVEWYSMTEEVCSRILRAKRESRRVVAVGTTSVRVLETVFRNPNKRLYGWTDLYIYPGFDFKVADAMITNFHLPVSSLMLLVSAFAGRKKIIEAYEFAIRNDYRFYSYGDAMLIL